MPKSFLIKKKSKEYNNSSQLTTQARSKETKRKQETREDKQTHEAELPQNPVSNGLEPKRRKEEIDDDDDDESIERKSEGENGEEEELDENGNRVASVQSVCADGRSKGNGCGSEKKSRYVCAECGKSYATSSNLSRHKQTHRSLDGKLARRCSHCGKAYVSMPALAMHVLTHKLLHKCDTCGKCFSRPWLLQGHMRSHTGERPYSCPECCKSFADRSNLRAHLQTHSPLKQFQCDRCDRTFALKSYLNKHLESACSRESLEKNENSP